MTPEIWNALKQYIEGGTQVISKRSLLEKMKQLEDRYTEELMGFFDGGD